MRLKVEVAVILRPQLFLKIISAFLKFSLALESTARIKLLSITKGKKSETYAIQRFSR